MIYSAPSSVNVSQMHYYKTDQSIWSVGSTSLNTVDPATDKSEIFQTWRRL